MRKESRGGKSEMSFNKNPLRPFGQRSITSTPLFRASNRSNGCDQNAGIKAPTAKASRISLSDFLNRKLHRSSVLPTSVGGTEIPSSSPSRDVKGEREKSEGREGKGKSPIKGALDINILKNIKNESSNEFRNTCSTNGIEIIDVDDIEPTRKRKCLFEDHDNKLTGRKRVVVLGDDSKPRRSSPRKVFTSGESKPFFNHYDNGGGWWDENMAGVDNEEVGCNDVWEGVGCTTLGGIEWH
ncbi:hypothetical protein SASPL_113409 [Salvia splendens]|uniref:Uncharacterized protein n=1 Tax=Salvia splendens TaxID=180675 RepID=A0A8X9A088_SALSN|nr:uncharacterized protein LOC121803210 isoform X1 [Salvia splendens]KAG6423026.1 hypothetical protein SASPL_113409 [Salvia splendens]